MLAHSDSQLVVNQVIDKFKAKEERIKLYKQEVKKERVILEAFEVKKIPRRGNIKLDSLATLASVVILKLKKFIYVS